MNLAWEGMRGLVSGIGITVTTPSMGFVSKHDLHSFHRPCWSSNSPISSWSRDGAGKVICSGPECNLSNASKSVDAILCNFAPRIQLCAKCFQTQVHDSYHHSTPLLQRYCGHSWPQILFIRILITWCERDVDAATYANLVPMVSNLCHFLARQFFEDEFVIIDPG